MKKLYWIIIIFFGFFFLSSFTTSIAADKKEYFVWPPEKISAKWRIGYLEGGPWRNYKSSLTATIKGLSRLGWIEPIVIPLQGNNEDTGRVWAWVCANVKSKYLKFLEDAWYSNSWDEKTRKETKKILLNRLNDKGDIDLMLAMGTWAGQDLANNKHSIPTIVGSTTDPVAAEIIKSPEDSGYDHIHARVDPTRDERQIRAFHDIFGFKKLGVPFEDTVTGRSYAAIGKIEKVALERGFKIVPCFLTHSDSKENELEIIKCAHDLALKTDAFYAPMYASINSKTSHKIIAALNKYNIPSFSQHFDMVRHGFLLSVSITDFDGLGKFHAETIARIINGEKPGDLNQIHEEPVKILFNAATAINIGMKPGIFNMLINTAEKVYNMENKN
ncbi:ABC transporter substrate binding protein [Desulfobacterales bacterium HSG17]|nr:ABC transporter substrate binding protein [Desulfobacterales bacterium HSG17]